MEKRPQGRPALPEEERRDQFIQARVTVAEVAALDRVRGDKTRSDYLRDLLRVALKRSRA